MKTLKKILVFTLCIMLTVPTFLLDNNVSASSYSIIPYFSQKTVVVGESDSLIFRLYKGNTIIENEKEYSKIKVSVSDNSICSATLINNFVSIDTFSSGECDITLKYRNSKTKVHISCVDEPFINCNTCIVGMKQFLHCKGANIKFLDDCKYTVDNIFLAQIYNYNILKCKNPGTIQLTAEFDHTILQTKIKILPKLNLKMVKWKPIKKNNKIVGLDVDFKNTTNQDVSLSKIGVQGEDCTISFTLLRKPITIKANSTKTISFKFRTSLLKEDDFYKTLKNGNFNIVTELKYYGSSFIVGFKKNGTINTDVYYSIYS